MGMDITRTSRISGITRTRDIDLTMSEVSDYINGALAQDAFAHLSVDDREFIISGITPEEWDDLFGSQPEAAFSEFLEDRTDG